MPITPIIFIHVPKTAGTSFRLGADQYFGKDKVCRDYGATSPETSDVIHEWLLDNYDPWYFKKAFEAEGYSFIAGHVPANRYVYIFGIDRMVTFLRDPLQRIISEYKHFVRHHGYKHSFEVFFRSDPVINRQARMFNGVLWPATGFIGITEQYDLSLDLFNSRFEVNIPRLEINIGKAKITHTHELSRNHEEELRNLNADEIVFYNQACRQLEWRKKLYKSNQVFSRGMIMGINGNRLTGWAVYDEGDDPVHLQVSINGKLLKEKVACEIRPQLRAFGLRRGGFVGFSLRIPSVVAGDEISITVSGTGQPLANSPWNVPEQ